MTKDILVIGSSSLLARSFSEYSVYKDRLIFQLRNYQPETLQISDPSDQRELERNLRDLPISVILNFAALANVEECERDIPAAYKANVQLLRALANWIIQKRPQTFLLNISTDHVYDSPLGQKAKEDEVIPKNVYALTKLMGELSTVGVATCNLRTNFFGKSFTRKATFSDWILGEAKVGRSIDAFSDIFFTPVSTVTLAAVIDSVIRIKLEGTYNFGCAEVLSKASFIFNLMSELDLDTRLIRSTSINDREDLIERPKNMAMDSMKIMEALALKPISIHDEIKRYKEEISCSTRS